MHIGNYITGIVQQCNIYQVLCEFESEQGQVLFYCPLNLPSCKMVTWLLLQMYQSTSLSCSNEVQVGLTGTGEIRCILHTPNYHSQLVAIVSSAIWSQVAKAVECFWWAGDCDRKVNLLSFAESSCRIWQKVVQSLPVWVTPLYPLVQRVNKLNVYWLPSSCLATTHDLAATSKHCHSMSTVNLMPTAHSEALTSWLANSEGMPSSAGCPSLVVILE